MANSAKLDLTLRVNHIVMVSSLTHMSSIECGYKFNNNFVDPGHASYYKQFFQGGAPASINRFINVRTSNYNLRGVNVLSLPKVNSTKYGLKCFSYYAAKQWNTLPDNIRTLAGTKDFVSKIRSITF